VVAAFKKESKEHPNYGKETGLAAPEWWAKVGNFAKICIENKTKASTNGSS